MTDKTDLGENFKASFGVPAELPGPVTPAGGTDMHRSADKTDGEKAMPKLTKTGMLASLLSTASTMTKGDLGDVLATLQGKGTDNAAKNRASISVKEDLDEMFQGDDLSEDFREKAATLFEAAVSVRVQSEQARLEEEFETALNEQIEALDAEYADKINQYMTYAIEQWVEKNELALETGVRAEVAESFFAGLKTLFTEHYIEVPEDKVDVLESLVAQVEELTTELNESKQQTAELLGQLSESTKATIRSEIAEGLTATQAERFSALTEEIDFADESEYRNKLNIIREHYFTAKPASNAATQLNEEVDVDDASNKAPVTHPQVNRYVAALDRAVAKS